MYDDAPDDLVHDLIGEVVFPGDALGRPGDRHGRDHRRADAGRGGRRTTRPTTAARHRRLRGRLGRPRRAGRAGRSRARLGARRRRAAARARSTAEAPPGRAFLERDTEQYHLCLGAPGVSRSDDRRFATSLLDQLLGGGASSRLFQEIRERRGMAYAVYTFGSHYRETGQVGVYVGTRGRERRGVPERDRARDRRDRGGRLRPGRAGARQGRHEGPPGPVAWSRRRPAWAGSAAPSCTTSRCSTRTEIAARIDAVTVDDIAMLAGELFAPARLSAACIGTDEAVFSTGLDALLAETV